MSGFITSGVKNVLFGSILFCGMVSPRALAQTPRAQPPATGPQSAATRPRPAATRPQTAPPRGVQVAKPFIDQATAELNRFLQNRKPGERVSTLPLYERLAHLRIKRGDSKALLEVAQAYFSQGLDAQANDQTYHLLHARAQAVAGDHAKFRKSLDDYLNSHGAGTDRSQAQGLVARNLALAEDFDGAWTVGQKVEGGLHPRLLQDLAVIAARTGHPEQYRKFIALADQRLAEAIKRAGPPADSQQESRDRLWEEPLIARLQSNDFAGVEEVLGRVKHPRARVIALEGLIQILFISGQSSRPEYRKWVDEARSLMAGLDPADAVRRMMELARVQTHGGDKDGALETLKRAPELRPKYWTDDFGDVIEWIARLGAAGDLKGARAMADKAMAAAKARPPGEERSVAFFGVACAYAAVGDLVAVKAALAQVKQIPGRSLDSHQQLAEARITQNLIRSGNYRAAEQFVAGLTGLNKRVRELDAARAAIAAGDFTIATKILKEHLAGRWDALPAAFVKELAAGYARAGRLNDVRSLTASLPPLLKAEAFISAAEVLMEEIALPPLLAPPPRVRYY